MSMLLLSDDAQDPHSLFAAGEQGFWYDPSDFSTMFQDAAGTTPVTAVGQRVGRILDKSGRGNHATQSTALSRPTIEARVNLFTESEFRNGVVDAPVRGGLLSATTLTGYLGALAFGHDGTTLTYAYKGVVITGLMYVASVVVKMDDGNAPTFGGAALNSSDNTFGIAVGGSSANPTQYSVVALGDGFYRVSTAVTTAGSSKANTGVLKYSTNNNRTFKVTAYDLRLASEAAYPYQRVNTATDYADVGAPRYLSFDGTDDGMVTNSIDFTGTDKMTLWAGAQSASTATNGMLAELSSATGAGNPGSMAILWPRLPYAINFVLAGTALASRSVSASADTALRVISCAFDISAAAVIDEIKPRVNDSAPSLVTVDTGPAGTGNYGNYPLYIGRRNGTSLPLNGRIYQLIGRGAETPLAQIVAMEQYVNVKTGAY